jgi:hypothetical protein
LRAFFGAAFLADFFTFFLDADFFFVARFLDFFAAAFAISRSVVSERAV